MDDTDLRQDFAVFRSEVKGDLKALNTSVESIARQLDSVVQMRDEITRMASNYEQWRSEKQTMWGRVDGLRDDIKALRDEELAEVRRELHQWEGASKLARIFFSACLVVGGTAIGWLGNEVKQISVIVEKVRVLELHDQENQKRNR